MTLLPRTLYSGSRDYRAARGPRIFSVVLFKKPRSASHGRCARARPPSIIRGSNKSRRGVREIPRVWRIYQGFSSPCRPALGHLAVVLFSICFLLPAPQTFESAEIVDAIQGWMSTPINREISTSVARPLLSNVDADADAVKNEAVY